MEEESYWTVNTRNVDFLKSGIYEVIVHLMINDETARFPVQVIERE